MAATDTRSEKGISLARGPALILGTILLAAGLYSIYKQHVFPPFSQFPNGKPVLTGKVFGLFEANGWTGMLTAVAGGLLLFGAAQHLLAKTMSLIVGVGLGAAAVIGLVSGNVLGMAASNGWTELAWAIAAAILLLNSLIPRRRREVETYGRPVGRRPVRERSAVGAGTGGAAAGAGATRAADDEPVTRTGADEPVTRTEAPTQADEPAVAPSDRDRTAVQPAADRDRPIVQGRDERTVVRRTEPGTADEPATGTEPATEPIDAPERRVRSTDDGE